YSFFLQAEDGIRDRNVTGVQTCALPISYHQASRPIAEPMMPNQRTVRTHPMRSPKAPKAALNRMLPAYTTVVIISQRDWPQPSGWAITFGRMMNIPNSGAVLISRVRNPIRIFLSLAVRTRPEKITDAGLSPWGASRMLPWRSRTPNQAIRNPIATTKVEAIIVQVSPECPPPKAGIMNTATSEPRVGRPPVNMT